MSDLVVNMVDLVGVVRFDRPAKKNALTRSTLQAIPLAVSQLVADGARSIVLAGSDTVFTAGADLAEFDVSGADMEVEQRLADAADALAATPVPVIAAIEGPCLGAGVEIALSCDMRVAGAGARFMIPAAKFGITYRSDGMRRVVNVVGDETARRLFLLHETLGPASMAGVVVDDGTAIDRALQMAAHVATLDAQAVAAMKASLA